MTYTLKEILNLSQKTLLNLAKNPSTDAHTLVTLYSLQKDEVSEAIFNREYIPVEVLENVMRCNKGGLLRKCLIQKDIPEKDLKRLYSVANAKHKNLIIRFGKFSDKTLTTFATTKAVDVTMALAQRENLPKKQIDLLLDNDLCLTHREILIHQKLNEKQLEKSLEKLKDSNIDIWHSVFEYSATLNKNIVRAICETEDYKLNLTLFEALWHSKNITNLLTFLTHTPFHDLRKNIWRKTPIKNLMLKTVSALRK